MNPKSLKDRNGRKDIISKLPDDVLCSILSHLPIQDAIRTTLLSSRWKDLWTSIYNLYFDNWPMDRCHENYRTQFLNFVDGVLTRFQSKDIHGFQLSCSCLQEKDLSHVIEWVCFAINHNVHRLSLCVHIRSKSISTNTILRLPQRIITCKTLVELRLGNDFVLDIPDSAVCFPNLKILHVRVEHPNGDLLKKLFGSCPVLEDLSICGSLDPDDHKHTFTVMVPTLKRLNIAVFVTYRQACEQKFVIETPNLEYLSIMIDPSACFVVNEIPFLKEASIGVGSYVVRKYKKESNGALELLRGIKNTKILSLPDSAATSFLGFANNDNLPTYSKLTKLKMEIMSGFQWKLLKLLLNNSPNLEVLILNLYWAYKPGPCQSDDIICENFDWIASENVPRCLLLHVKVIKIKKMQREAQLLNVVKYLLKNSIFLEKLLVDFWEPLKEKSLQKEILMFPKGSKTCTIEFL